MSDSEYGPAGRVGIGTPQANPTVEPEMAILLGPRTAMYTTRLTSGSPDSRTRLIDYFETLGRRLGDFDTLPLDVFGFACTGSSYLVGAQREADVIAELEDARGFKIVTAGMAVRTALTALNALRIALVTPYPDWLCEASIRYWRDAGIVVTATATVALASGDTRSIYALSADDAVAAANRLDCSGADAVLIAGTGLPTLRCIGAIARHAKRPVLSSNLCLAWALLGALDQLPIAAEPFNWGWEQRLGGA